MSRLAFLLGAVLVLVGVGVISYVAFFTDEEAPAQVLTLPGPAPSREPSPSSTPDAPGPPIATPTPSDAAISRLQVPSVEIDAAVVTLGVLSDGTMESPYGPFDVGWYDFSAQPGLGSNAVFAGHVDYVNVGPAVFYRLRELQTGDEVVVTLADGTDYTYAVVSSQLYDTASAPVQQIVGPTDIDTLTLITCAGAFNRDVLEYDKRLVVKAQRSG